MSLRIGPTSPPQGTRRGAAGTVAESLRAVLDLGLPLVCAVCTRPGAPCCAECLAACSWPGGVPLLRSPRPCPPGFPPTWAGGPYDGELRRLLVAYKDEDRRDLREPLGGLLAPVLWCAAQAAVNAGAGRAGQDSVLLVPVPSSPAARRRRGDAPLATLVATAVGATRSGRDVLRVARRVADQAGLDAAGRAENLAGAFRATALGREQLAGRSCVIVDDVITTGATILEAARAIRVVGGHPVAAAVLAATPRRR